MRNSSSAAVSIASLKRSRHSRIAFVTRLSPGRTTAIDPKPNESAALSNKSATRDLSSLSIASTNAVRVNGACAPKRSTIWSTSLRTQSRSRRSCRFRSARASISSKGISGALIPLSIERRAKATDSRSSPSNVRCCPKIMFESSRAFSSLVRSCSDRASPNSDNAFCNASLAV